MTRITIEPLPDRPRGHYRVDLDGTDIAGAVTEATLVLKSGGKPATVTLELAIFDRMRVELDEPVLVVGPHTIELLQKLGWTPPPEALEQHGRDQQAEQ